MPVNDSLLDDVKDLLDKDFGDDRILKQIRRACENNEIISNYERNYVVKLAERHLGRKSQIIQTHTPVEEPPVIPDVILPTVASTRAVQYSSSRVRRLKIKKSKMMGLGAVTLLVIVVAAVSIVGLPSTKSGPTQESLSVLTDLLSYDNNDIISISGVSDTSGTVNLSIENKDKEIVWTEEIDIRHDGRYSTLTIAGGDGWESSGTYTIKVSNGKETESGAFSFNA